MLTVLAALWPGVALAGGPADALGSRSTPGGSRFSEQLHAWPCGAFPLKVYVEPVPEAASAHREDYRQAVEDSLLAWNKVGIGGRPVFVRIDNRAAAEVLVVWQLDFNPDIGGLEITQMSTFPGARTFRATKRSKVTLLVEHWKRHSVPTGLLGFLLPIPVPNYNYEGIEQRGAEEVRAIATHELGHSLGLEHSTDKSDIMYPIEAGSFFLMGIEIPNTQTLSKGTERQLAEHYRSAWQDFGTAPPATIAQTPSVRDPQSPALPLPPTPLPQASLPPGQARVEANLLDAAEQGQTAEVSRLLAGGQSIETRDDNGWTPLIAAASQGRAETVTLLLQKGADVNVKDYEGYTALRYAKANGYPQIVELLKAAGAKD